MLKDITIGQYFPGDSVLHRMDPRAKIITMILYMVALFLCANAMAYIELTIFTLIIVAIAGVPVKMLLKGLKPLWFILILTFCLHVFMTPGEIIWQWGIIEITVQGLRQAVFMVIRLVYLVTITSLLTLTTTPIALTDGIELLLKVIRIPIAHELAMMMTIALRFIPTLIEETEKIMKAQLARGADFENGGLIARAKSLIPLLVPLFLSSFRRADELAMAMEARCYRGGENRTRMKQLTMGKRDGVAFVVSALFLVIVLLTNNWA